MGNNAIIAKHGDKMPKVTVSFFSNGVVDGDRIIPKHMYGFGIVRIVKNDSHGITSNQRHFKDIDDLPRVIKQLLDDNGMVVH